MVAVSPSLPVGRGLVADWLATGPTPAEKDTMHGALVETIGWATTVRVWAEGHGIARRRRSSQFEPAEATLKDLKDYADEQAEITERFAERDAERRDYLDGLIRAAGDDLSWTWQEAHEAWAATSGDVAVPPRTDRAGS